MSINTETTASAKRTKFRKLGNQPEPSSPRRALYLRAEADLKHRRPAQAGAIKSIADTERLLHELQVHQVELELQNTELQESRDGMESLLEKFSDLYDFAPVGYFTLAAKGEIRLVNLTGARLLEIDRSRLLGRLLGRYFPTESQPVFHAFLKRVFAGEARQSCEVTLLTGGGPMRVVNIEAQRSVEGRECRAVMTDITERKQVEAKVRISEIRYRRLFETTHDGVLLLDPGTRRITDANPFMTKLLGYSREQLVGKELFEIGLLQDEVASQEMFRKLKQKHEVRYEDLPLESQDGRHQEVEVVANFYQEDGHSVIQCNIRDITERKRTEVALTRLAAIVSSSDDAIIGKDLNGIITNWNRGAENIFGYSAKEMVGVSIQRLIPADRPLEEAHILGRIRRGESIEHFETVRKTKDGRLINVSVTASPIKEITGRIIGVSKVARDITERKQSAEVLRRNAALFTALIEQAPVGLYVVDEQLRLQQINPKAQQIFKPVRPLLGRQLSEILGTIWSRKITSEIVKHFRHTLRTGKPYYSPGFTERRRDTEVTESYEWQLQRIVMPTGVQGVVCFFNDITERKQAEAARHRIEVLAASNRKLESEILRRREVEASLKQSEQHQRQLLEQSRQMQEQLRRLSRQVLQAQEAERKRISRELHDVIAQTLTGINIQLAALKQGTGLNPKNLDRNITRTQRLVEQSVEIVHRFARELRPTVLDDLGLIPALHAFLKSFTTRTGVRTSLTAFAAIEKMDGTLRTVLYRVALEALTNVSRHAQASQVEVSLQQRPQAARMEIKDNGRSFDVERTARGKGSKRLGLLGMRERVEMVGGAFGIRSTPGQGTTVWVELPFAKAPKVSALNKNKNDH